MDFNQWSIKIPNQKIAASVQKLKDCIEINTVDGEYSIVNLQYRKKEVAPDSIYQFRISLSSENAEYRIVYTWMDRIGTQLLRGYANKEDRLISPKGAEYLLIELIVYSFKKGRVTLSDIEIKYLHKYHANNVVMAAVHVDTKRDFYTTCENNLRNTLDGIDQVSCEKPDVIVLTECFYNRRTNTKSSESAIRIQDEPIRLLQEKAKQYNTYIAFSFKEDLDGKYSNTGVLIDRAGKIMGTYRKTHLTMSEIEYGQIPGMDLPVFETDFGKVAIVICWDMWFPELVREYFKMGVKVLLNPTAGFPDIQTRARAMDNGMYIVSAGVMNRTNTRIINPNGEEIANALDNGYAAAKVDLNEPKVRYWLSVGDTYGEGRNLYPFEARRDLYTKW